MDNFTHRYDITSEKLSTTEEKVEARYQQGLTRFQSIVERSAVNGVPIVNSILEITRKPEDLLMLSRVLARLAEIIPDMEKLANRRHLLKVFTEESDWLQVEFGNFDAQLTELINDINKG